MILDKRYFRFSKGGTLDTRVSRSKMNFYCRQYEPLVCGKGTLQFQQDLVSVFYTREFFFAQELLKSWQDDVQHSPANMQPGSVALVGVTSSALPSP